MRYWGVFLVVLLTTACSARSASESPENGGTNTPSAEWSTPEGNAPSSSVNRPAELDMDDVRSCDLLTEDQLAELGLTGEQTSDLSSTWATDTCKTWDADKVLSASVTAVSTEGMDAFHQGRFANMEYRRTDVQGFPALFYRFENVEHACYLAVDIADDQLVDIAFGANDPDSTDASLDDLCATAHRVAEAAVDTLLE